MKEKIKIYISGPITNCLDTYKEKFKQAKEEVEKQGYEAVNPAELYHEKFEYIDYIIADLLLLRKCDGIYMLKDWEESNGAKIEYAIAMQMKKKVLWQGKQIKGEVENNE